MPKSFPGRDAGLRQVPLVCLFLLVLILFAVVALPPSSRAIRVQDQTSLMKGKTRPEFVPGEILVRYKNEVAAKRQPQSTMLKNFLGRELAIQVERFQGSEIVAGLRMARVAPEHTMSAIEALRKQPDVLYAEPNYIVHADLTPNDPRFLSNELYGLGKIAAPQAWDTTTGSSSVVVGVIDEGIDLNHEDLLANVWTNPSPGSVAGVSGDLHGYNFVDNTGTIPGESHATHVAGIVGAKGNNGIGVVGVNWNVSLMSLRVLGSGGGSDSDLIGAYDYARQMRALWTSSGGSQGANIRVLNNSYGGGGFSQASFDAISALSQSGILFVGSAGNDGTDSDVLPHYPSGYELPHVISVASTNSGDVLVGGSNFGVQSVDLGAPGSVILSTTPGNTYANMGGTSMASPHVAGAAALICAANPNVTLQQLKALLIFNGDVLPDLQGKTLTGRRLNVGKSLQALAENDVTAPGIVSDFRVNTQNGRSLNLAWTASGDDGTSGQASLYQLSFTDGVTGAVVPFKSVIPVSSGSQQTLDVKLPYRHTSGTITLREFDNVGNEGPPATLTVSVSIAEGNPYALALGNPAALSTGGTLLPGLNFDDRYKENHPLPFAFPFFGQAFNTVTISTNGSIYFSTPPTRTNGDADDVPGAVAELSKYKMIAGLWDDLYLGTDQRADAGVYAVQPDSSRIIFRWQGVPCNSGPTACNFGGAPINFEIELRSDGRILTRYGSGNLNVFSVVGISGGEPDPYVITSHTSEQTPINLTNAAEVTFIPRAQAPGGGTAKTGVFRPSTGELFLKNSNSSGFADIHIVFGNPGDYPIAGDWNGDGMDTVGIYRNGVFYLRNSNSTGFADIVVAFGNPSDQPVVGDWNGDGTDTIGVYRNGTFILRNSNTAGAPDLIFTLGDPGDVAIAGDWDGDGIETGGVFRPSNGIVYLRNTNSTGFADAFFIYGNPGDKPVAGDWNADGIDSIGIYRDDRFFLTDSNFTGFANIVFLLGNPGDFPIAGNWNGQP